MAKLLTATAGILFILTAFIGCNNSDTTTKNSDKSILSFSFTQALNPKLSTSQVDGVIDEVGKTITLQVNANALPNLIATFSMSDGARLEVDGTLQESGVTSNDFSKPVTYTVTTEDGTTENYTVSVTTKSSDKSITSFSFTQALNPKLSTSEVKGVIDETGKTIVLQVHGNAFPNLIATFSMSVGAKLEVAGTPQESGVTSNDFSNPVTYTVTAEDGSTEIYTVSVTSAYTVTFDSGSGSDVPAQSVQSDGKAARPMDNPQRSGYLLDNWYTDNQFQTVYNFDQPVTGDITLYANWVEANLKHVIDKGFIPQDLHLYNELTQAVLEPYESGAAVVAKYAAASAQGNGDASSWTNASGDIKVTLDAITDAEADKIYLVLAASGTHTLADTLVMKNHLAIVGGWDEWEQTGTTTISGNNTVRVINNNNLGHASLFYGITIADGKGTVTGGGMSNSSSSPTLINVTFSGNEAIQGGGGMYNYSSSPTLINVTFADNTAGHGGGGMFNEFSSSPTLINVTFSGNKADSSGGMGNSANSSPTLINVTFTNNGSSNNGGGMGNHVSKPTLINVTFFGNTADKEGGGIYNDGGYPTIVNTLLWNNTGGASSETVGQQIYIDNEEVNTENMPITFSLVQHGIGTTTGATSDNNPADGLGIGGGSNPVTVIQAHNISGNPMLAADPADNGGFVQTMALLDNSSAANAGVYVQRSGTPGSYTFYYSQDNTNWFSNPMLTTSIAVPADAVYLTDARGYIRNDRPDIGAYEYGGTAP